MRAERDRITMRKRAATISQEQSGSKSGRHGLSQQVLLAGVAHTNYEGCHRALKSLEFFWAGIKYIVTVLDQKAEGVRDPVLYTSQEMAHAQEPPVRKIAFHSPGWRRKLSWDAYSSKGDGACPPTSFAMQNLGGSGSEALGNDTESDG